MKNYKKIWHISRGLIIIALVIWFFYAVRSILTPFLLGFFIAYVLHPLVDMLEKKNLPRGFAVAVIYIFFSAAAVAVLFFALPAVIRDLNSLADVIPQYTAIVQKLVEDFQTGYSRVTIPDSIRAVADGVIGKIEKTTMNIVQGMANGIVMLFSQTFNLALAPLLSVYFLMDYKEMGYKALKVLPSRYRTGAVLIAQELDAVIIKVIRGNLLVAALVAILTTIGMLLVGMDFPLLIGILAGITNFIPYFGAIFSAIPITLLALLKSKWLAAYVLGIMVLIQQLEGNIISPKILGGCIGLHPLVIIFALLAGGSLWGFTGMILAVPLAAVLKVLLKRVYFYLI